MRWPIHNAKVLICKEDYFLTNTVIIEIQFKKSYCPLSLHYIFDFSRSFESSYNNEISAYCEYVYSAVPIT